MQKWAGGRFSFSVSCFLSPVSCCFSVLVLVSAVFLGAAFAQPAQVRALLTLADRVVVEVGELRGLPAKTRVARGALSRAQLGERIRARVREEYTPAEVRAEGLLWLRLGLVPVGTRYGDLVFALLEEQVAGYYDTRDRRLFLASWLGPDLQAPTLAHEIEHALQDQHFGLGERLRALRDDADARAALSALAEGDGVAVMIDYLARGTGRDFTTMPDLAERLRAQSAGDADQPVLASSPRALRETLLFPYVAGVSFVRTLKVRGGWRAVDDAFRDPPASTEQVLHPERYLRRDPPIPVELPRITALEGTHDEVYRDVLGEFQVRLWLQETMEPADAVNAAAGWGGDRAIVLARRGAPEAPPLGAVTVVLRSTWDSEDDAREAAAAFAMSIAARHRGARSSRRPTRQAYCLPDGTAALVERRGREIVYVEGAPAEALEAVRRQAWGA